MAGKARLLSEVIEKALTSDETHNEDSTLKDQMNAFKQILIHDITPKGFADVYAQTIAYGMFAARYHDPTLPTFSRQEAYELIPKSNPFLKKLFGYIAGLDVDDRIKWIVDDLINIFLACDVAEIFNVAPRQGVALQEDPIIHFYETFLSEYDPKLRKARGVWYTPAPVVNFIVRAVDDILKTEFDLPQGLADTSKIKLPVGTPATANVEAKVGVPTGFEGDVHRVQILDPATGTGTFLAEVVKLIYNKGFKNMQGVWSNYVESNLLPRLNGFEILMASYAMAHLKLDMLLTETGYKPTTNQRLRIYLTNSLEEHHPDTGTLFANWLSAEANEANQIKRDTPVMCVIGNPPYSIISSNLSASQKRIIEKYKFINKEKIKERGALQLEKNLNDDYVKFIGLGEDLIIKNGTGALAYINNHNFLDGPTFRGMRWHLLKTFDSIYIIDLHGNAKKNEINPDGGVDKNVFDIQQGVSINIFVKSGKKNENELAKVFQFDLFGERQFKYDFLIAECLSAVKFQTIYPQSPNYEFVKRNYKLLDIYNEGFSMKDLFPVHSTGIISARDTMVIGDNAENIIDTVTEFQTSQLPNNELCRKIGISEKKGWDISKARKLLSNIRINDFIKPINYRPFDNKFIFYHQSLVWTMAQPVMQHFADKKNIGLVIPRQAMTDNWSHIQVINVMIDNRIHYSNKGIPILCPLYLYPTAKKNVRQQQLKSNEKLKLQHQLELAKATFKQVSEFFLTVVKPYFDKIENPNEAAINLFEENRSLYEESQATVESLKNEIKNIDGNENIFFDEHEKKSERTPNLNTAIVKQIAENLGLTFTNEKETTENTFAPIDILDYIYAVLHSPSYREKYKEFLKIDFPRVPYPCKDAKYCVSTFWQFVKLGGELRQIHLLENPVVEKFITEYPVDGNHTVTKPIYINGKVYINENQYFDKVPEVAWNFYIGGYQPAQKWLKDRKDRKLEFDDILHYQKIIVALTETDKLMKEIDRLENE